MKLCQLMTILCLTNYFCTIVQTMPRTDRHVVIQTEDERRDKLFYELFDMISQRYSGSSTFIYSVDKIKEKFYDLDGHTSVSMIMFIKNQDDMSLLDQAISSFRSDVIRFFRDQAEKLTLLIPSIKGRFNAMMRDALITALKKHNHGFIIDYAMVCGYQALEDAQLYLSVQQPACSVCIRSLDCAIKPSHFADFVEKKSYEQEVQSSDFLSEENVFVLEIE